MATGQPTTQPNSSSVETTANRGRSSGYGFRSRVDRFVDLLKWPSAIAALLITPLIAWALVRLAVLISTNPSFSLLPFSCGAVVFWAVWRRWLGRNRFGNFIVTLEHELTHALFALMTFHPIVGFRASLRTGGHVRFAGKGNWLIVAAPYFFPSAACLLFIMAFFMPFSSFPWQNLLLGVALSYHLLSTWRETHRDQHDLRILGPAFCWMFLPAANLSVIGLLFSYAHSGTQGMHEWLLFIRQPLDLVLEYILQSTS